MKKLFVLFTVGLFVLVHFNLVAQEQATTLDKAIELTTSELAGKIRAGSMLVVLGFSAPNVDLQNYIIDEIIDHLVKNDSMKVIDRQNAAVIQKEMGIQYSGDVDDKFIQGIGHQYGAEFIVTGSFEQQNNLYRLRLENINVRTAQLMGRSTAYIQMDAKLASLLHIRWVDPEAWKHKWLSIGLRFGGGMNLYSAVDFTKARDYYMFDPVGLSGADLSFGLNGAFFVSINLTSWFGIQAEAMYVHDETEVKTKSNGRPITLLEGSSIASDNGSGKIAFDSFVLPVLVKFMIKPGNFYFGGLVGPYFCFPVGNAEFNGKLQGADWSGYFSSTGVSVGLMAGGDFGLHLGPGILFFDVRYAIDLKKQEFEPVSGSWGGREWWKIDMPKLEISGSKILFTVGYKFLLFNKKKNMRS